MYLWTHQQSIFPARLDQRILQLEPIKEDKSDCGISVVSVVMIFLNFPTFTLVNFTLQINSEDLFLPYSLYSKTTFPCIL